MIRTSITAILALLLLSTAHAETAKLMRDAPANLPGETRQICYYEAGGFTYHYVGGLMTRCAATIETPFAPVPRDEGVLLKDEPEAHQEPRRLCYYGLSGGRLWVERTAPGLECTWTPSRPLGHPIPPTGKAGLLHEEDAATGAPTKICFYRVGDSSYRERFTHYMIISKYSLCPEYFQAQRP
jgi:hypothetical protein